MGPDQLVLLAKEIAQRLPSEIPLAYLLVLVVLTFIATAAGAFVAEFARTRGARYATAAQFDQIHEELKKTTATTTKIKQDIEQSAWSEREYRTIRRQKLEELFSAIAAIELWLDGYRNHALFDEDFDEPIPLSRAEALAWLYFPELFDSFGKFRGCVLEFYKWLVEKRQLIVDVKLKMTACKAEFDFFAKHPSAENLQLMAQKTEELKDLQAIRSQYLTTAGQEFKGKYTQLSAIIASLQGEAMDLMRKTLLK